MNLIWLYLKADEINPKLSGISEDLRLFKNMRQLKLMQRKHNKRYQKEQLLEFENMLLRYPHKNQQIQRSLKIAASTFQDIKKKPTSGLNDYRVPKWSGEENDNLTETQIYWKFYWTSCVLNNNDKI